MRYFYPFICALLQIYMQNISQSLTLFVQYCQTHLKGDEKGEAQIFLDHFFTALGYSEGLKGAGATCEFRIKNEQKRSTSFADLVWKPVVLIEMKKRGEDLAIHYQQAFTYWTQLVPDRPQYVILCNFDAFWIYNLNINIYEPLEKIALTELPNRLNALSFMFPEGQRKKPLFNNNKEDVTVNAAEKVAAVFASIVKTRTQLSREDAMRYCLQCILAMYAEDIDLLPDKIFTRLLNQCADNYPPKSDFSELSYDLIAGLFREMNTIGQTPVGTYKGVDYFNGGLFQQVVPLALRKNELLFLQFAADKNWRNVNPAIFGTIFQQGLEKGERHVLGAHYTSELDIKKIIDPVLVQPWNERIDAAQSLDELYSLLNELCSCKVLDPSCGSGNFLFIAFKEMKLLERKLIAQVRELSTRREDSKRLIAFLDSYSFVNIKQFYGYDKNPVAVELAKVTLMIAKEMAWLEHKESYDNKFQALPLDNLDNNILCVDALLNPDGTVRKWIDADVIVGNPPYQSRSKMLSEFGAEYMNTLYTAYPDMNRYADFCTFWYYKAHQTLKEGGYAGLVGTNTIRENNSREASLDYIVNNGGTIFNAVSSQKWEGEAVVHVSIVNWTKGDYKGQKFLYFQPEKETILTQYKVVDINSSLSLSVDVKDARPLKVNTSLPKYCFMGQKHGHEGFLLTNEEAAYYLKKDAKNADVLKPYLIGRELVANVASKPERYVIDFSQMNIIEASAYKDLFKIIEKKVLPDRKAEADKQENDNKILLTKTPKAKVNKSYIQYYKTWWQIIGKRQDMINEIEKKSRYIACSRVSLRQIFEFVDIKIRPNDQLIVFTFEDDYSFGIIQSSFHWEWWKAKCSTLGGTFRYTIDPVWDTFPFPQSPTEKQIAKVAAAAVKLRTYRHEVMQKNKWSLRDLYRTLDLPGKNPLRDLHEALDKAVGEAYLNQVEGGTLVGFRTFEKFRTLLTSTKILPFLLDLNLFLSAKEAKGEAITAPGLPAWAKDNYITDDCVEIVN